MQCAVAGTRLPSTTLLDIADTTNEHGPRSILNPPISPAGALSTIPENVADFLFENYRTREVAQYPIFYSADIVRYYHSVFHNQISGLEPGALATPYEVYVVSLVMAISLTTAARTQQAWANSIAAGLLKTAMQHIRSVCTNDIAGLQALLLLLEYGFLDPSAANVWFLSGFTTQACIDLGLHHESLDSRGMDHLTIDVRRRVFWCAYEMEIATSGALLRPSSLLNKEVSVPFPAEVDDDAISASGVDSNGRATKFASRRIWKYRQVEAKVVSVLFHSGEIPHNSLDAWMDEIETKVNSWHEEIYWSATLNPDTEKVSQWEEMCLYADIAREYIIVTLFRPSPRIKEPKSEHLMKAFRAGVGIADGYRKQSNLGFGNSKYVFHCCYHTFSGAIVFLQALQRCKESISATYSLDEVENFLARFSRFFTTIVERWPSASRCLEEFERLAAPVKREYVDYTVQKARNMSNDGSPDRIAVLGEHTNDLPPDSPWQLDDLINFGPLMAPELWNPEASSELSFTVPSDWNAEFDFGMI